MQPQILPLDCVPRPVDNGLWRRFRACDRQLFRDAFVNRRFRCGGEDSVTAPPSASGRMQAHRSAVQHSAHGPHGRQSTRHSGSPG